MSVISASKQWLICQDRNSQPPYPPPLYTGLNVLLTYLYFLPKTKPTLVLSGVPLQKHGTSLNVLSPSGQVTYYHLVGGGYVCVYVCVNGWVVGVGVEDFS